MSSTQEHFAQLPRNSIRKIAESVHFYNLPVDVLSVLAEDSNYRLREAIINAVQFMNRSRRKTLTVADFNKAIQGADNEPILGYLNAEPLMFKQCESEESFVIENEEIDFMEKALNKNEGEISSKYCLKGSWLSVGDSNTEPVSMHPHINIVTDDLKKYFQVILAAVFGSEKKLCTLALSDLKSNPNISLLLPFFTEFISSEIKRCHDIDWLRKILQTVKAVNTNPNLFLGHESILKELINSLLHCVTTFLTVSVDDEWAFRDTAAHLLSDLLKKWTKPFVDLYTTTLSEIKRIFENLSEKFYSHYGVIVISLSLGVLAIEEVIIPNLPKYWPHLNSTLASAEMHEMRQKQMGEEILRLKSGAAQVYGMLLVTCEFYLRSQFKEQLDNSEIEVVKSTVTEEKFSPSNHVPKQETEPMDVSSENSSNVSQYTEYNANWDNLITALFPERLNAGKKTIFEIYQDFYEQFGDALSLCLPYSNVRISYKCKKEKDLLIQLHSCPELSMTDEELLQQFKEKNDDDNIDANKRYFQVKNTVTDPHQGVKITIAKIPQKNLDRDTPSKSTPVIESAVVVKDSLKRRKVIGDPEPPFEVVSRIKQFPTINFVFNGSTQRPVSMLKRNNSLFSNLSSGTSQLHKISSKLKYVAKRKIAVKTRPISRIFLCSIKNTL